MIDGWLDGWMVSPNRCLCMRSSRTLVFVRTSAVCESQCECVCVFIAWTVTV